MRFISVLIPSFFLISSVLAGRRREHHLSQPHNLAKRSTSAASNRPTNGNKTSNCWVHSTASAVVGIDGDTCTDVRFHAGVLFTVTPSGPSYSAWYEWDPDSTHLSDPSIDISPGDVIRLTVSTPWNETSGLAAVQNLNNSQSTIQHFNSQRALCGRNAVWIVVDYAKPAGLPLANFGTVNFLEAKADAKNGQTYLSQGATVTEIVELNDQPLTSVSVNKDIVLSL